MRFLAVWLFAMGMTLVAVEIGKHGLVESVIAVAHKAARL